MLRRLPEPEPWRGARARVTLRALVPPRSRPRKSEYASAVRLGSLARLLDL